VVQSARNADEMVLEATDVQHILARAVASASLCVMEVGCVPPSHDQVVERVATLRPMFRSL
jgi:fructokinase